MSIILPYTPCYCVSIRLFNLFQELHVTFYPWAPIGSKTINSDLRALARALARALMGRSWPRTYAVLVCSERAV